MRASGLSGSLVLVAGVGIVATGQVQDRRNGVREHACWVVTGCGREPGGARVEDAGSCPAAGDPAFTRQRLPVPLCPVMEDGTERQIREVVRRLVEAAI